MNGNSSKGSNCHFHFASLIIGVNFRRNKNCSRVWLGYFFLSPPLSPDKYFLRQILKTGAKLGQILCWLFHVTSDRKVHLAQLAPRLIHSRPPSHPTVTCDRHMILLGYIRIFFDEHVSVLLPFSVLLRMGLCV